MKKQLILKGIITEEDWNDWRSDLTMDYAMDNHFAELKSAEILRERIQTLDMVQNYVGEYFSKEWILKNVLNLSEDEVEDMNKEIAGETPDDNDETAPDRDN